MRRAVWLLLVPLLFLIAGCTGSSSSSNTAQVRPTASETPAPVILPTFMEVLPTPTPVPPPPTPTSPPAVLMPTPTSAAASGTTPAVEATAIPTKEISEVPMIAIPAGEFTMGNDSGDGDETPAHKVSVDAFEIDKFEVTNEQFRVFVDQTGHVSTAEKAGESATWRTYAEGKPNHPVVLVSWNDAVAYCEWAGKRLPTEAEWEKAARGPEGFIYPWGNEWATGKANTEESGYRGTTIVGSFPDGASPYGLMDMAGNVSEWTSDWYEAYPGSTCTSGYFGKKYRVIRGGGWFSDAHLVRTTERSCSTVDLHNDDVGFRCVR
jgi:formylglycine-generating enzyme required for sulfatase activity